MKKSDLLARLADLEEKTGRRLTASVMENDQEAPGKSLLAELLAGPEGDPKDEPLCPSERVEYWQRKVDETELLITRNGASPDDERLSNSGPTSRSILQALRYEIACEEIAEFRQKLGEAERAVMEERA